MYNKQMVPYVWKSSIVRDDTLGTSWNHSYHLACKFNDSYSLFYVFSDKLSQDRVESIQNGNYSFNEEIYNKQKSRIDKGTNRILNQNCYDMVDYAKLMSFIETCDI